MVNLYQNYNTFHFQKNIFHSIISTKNIRGGFLISMAHGLDGFFLIFLIFFFDFLDFNGTQIGRILSDFSDFFWSDPLSKNQENQRKKSEKIRRIRPIRVPFTPTTFYSLSLLPPPLPLIWRKQYPHQLNRSPQKSKIRNPFPQ